MSDFSLSGLSQFGSSPSSTAGLLDVQSIVEQIIYAKQQPIRELEVYQFFYEAKRTAFQDLNTKLSAVERALYSVNADGFRAKSVNSSDPSIVTASAGATADSGNYELIVKQLAKAQSSATASFDSSGNGVLAQGTTFSLTQGGKQVDIAIEGDTRSLNGLRNAINSSDLDVRASVVNSGSTYYLQIVSSQTGTDKSFTVSDTDVGTNVASRQIAQDAQFYLNTDPVANPDAYLSRQSNSINDVIQGVTFQLKKAAADPVLLTVSADTEGVAEKIGNFVEQYNTAITFLNDQFTYDSQAGRSGVLSGESAARKAQSDLLSFVSSRVAGLNDSDRFKTLSTIGISMGNDGTLSVDSSKLADALNSNYDNVVRLFTNQGVADNSEISYSGKSSVTKAGTYNINITRVAEQASAVADYPLPGTLGLDASGNETMAISLNGKSVNVALTFDMNIADIVSAINTTLDGAGIKAFASQSSNILSILSTDFGSEQTVSVSSTGTALFGSSKTGTGVDVAGTIGGSAASGSARLLTGTAGDSKGMMVFTDTQTVGNKGPLTVTFGVGEQLRQRMYDLTFPYSGLLAKNVEALDTQLENIDLKIADINRNLAKEEELLIQQFSRANEALSQLQYLQTSLSNSFKA